MGHLWKKRIMQCVSCYKNNADHQVDWQSNKYFPSVDDVTRTSMPSGVHTYHGNFHCFCLAVCVVCSGPRAFEIQAHNISYSSKKPLDSAVVHSTKSKDWQSLISVDKHWRYIVCNLTKKHHLLREPQLPT